jgi:hypothetical protein
MDPEVERTIETHAQRSEKLQAFPIPELTHVIKQLHPFKAPASDLITAIMIQEMPPEGLRTLLHIFNVILGPKYWPATLKHAKIFMLPKPGKTPLGSHPIDLSVSYLSSPKFWKNS